MSDLRGFSAAELALGPRGLGPYLKNREVLERRFAQCRVLEQLIAGAAVDQIPSKGVTPGSAEMQFTSSRGALAFELVEAVEGHPLHGSKSAVRIYCMVPCDPATEAAISDLVAHYPAASAQRRAG